MSAGPFFVFGKGMMAPVTGRTVLIVTALVSLVMGTVHAFSVFIAPLEASFGAPRATVSLAYAVSLVAIAVAVLLGRWIYPVARPHVLLCAACGVAALGAACAAAAPTMPLFILAYAVVFGLANGVGYGFGLQLAALANPGREGLAMGLVTAAYAAGAALAPLPFSRAISAGGVDLALVGLAAVLVVVGAASWRALSSCSLRFQRPPATSDADAPLAWMWFAYGAAVFAGLMTIGHADTIARDAGLAASWLAPTVMALANLLGSVAAGRLADAWSPTPLLVALALLTGLASAGLASAALPVLLPLAVIGGAYGGFIAVFPAMIAKRFGSATGAWVYGRVFTAWGVAGLAAPWLAGVLFDRTGAYAGAATVAAVLAAAATVLLTRLPKVARG